MVKSIKYQPADAILNFSRASVKNVFNRLGVLEEVGVDSPAYSHNPGKTNTSSDSFDLDALTFLQTVTINQDSSNNFSVGDTITVTNSNNLFDYFYAKIESISTDTLTVEVQGVYGTGEFSSWFLIESEGLLIEEERENLFQYSEDFTTSFWNKSDSTITANATDAPDGTKTADKLVENGANSNHGLSVDLGFNFVSGNTYTQSWFVKPDERTEIQLSWRSDHFPPDSEVIFDLSNGTLTEGANATGTIEELKNGYYRISATATSDSTGSSPNDVFLFLINGGNQVYTGDGSSGLYVWGAQLEEASSSSSYIKTEGSTVIRAADVASQTDLSKWFNSNEGTIFFIGKTFSEDVGTRFFSISDGTSSNRIIVYFRSSGVGMLYDYSGSTESLIETGVANQSNKKYKVAVSYSGGSISVAIDGSYFSDSISNLPDNMNQLGVGRSAFDSNFFNGAIENIEFFTYSLTQSKMEELTS